VELSAALTSYVHDLSDSLAGDASPDALAALAADLQRAVPSYLGLQLVLYDHGHEVTLTAFDPTSTAEQVSTSLRVALSVLGVFGGDPSSAITFYAANPGAFVDLEADLAFALPRDARAGIVVDDDRRPTTLHPGLTGAAELSTINRAVGILIGSGYHPEDAHGELERRAAAAGVTVLAIATQLVRPASG
jgi:hypothetical protein